MKESRRRVLGLLAGLPWYLPRCIGATTVPARVVIVGGGWGGLSAAAALSRLAPEHEVTVIEPEADFFSLPLSNKWLVDQIDLSRLQTDRQRCASACRRVQARATAIDRERREVRTEGGRFAYDWLVLATGIRHDYGAWFGDDERAIEMAKARYGAAYLSGQEVAELRRKVDHFAGGDFLLTIPPNPYRCPPAPYERAAAIAHRFRQRGVKGRVILLDPGPGILGFRQLFAERYAGRVLHVTNASVRAVDLAARTVRTEFEDYRFDDAILMPPQAAHALVAGAGLAGRDVDGKAAAWADQDPLHLHARDDERIFLVGDLLGPASPLFGHYPKSAHLAVRLGAIAAAEIVARARGVEPPSQLPQSVCHVTSDFALPEALRIDTSYRRRGDGLIVQTGRVSREPQPRGEDEAWLAGLIAELV